MTQLLDPRTEATYRRKAAGLESIAKMSEVVARRSGSSLAISFPPETTAEQVKSWALACGEYVHTLGAMRSVGKLWLGSATLEYAARTGMTPAEALDDLGFPEMTGLKNKTLLQYVRAVEKMGEDCYIEGLSDEHVITAANFKGPTRPDLASEFAQKRRDLLLEIAQPRSIDPETGEATGGWTTKRVAMRMREIQQEYDILPTGKRQQEDLVDRYIRLSYIYRHADDEWYSVHGVSKKHLIEWMEASEIEIAEKELGPYSLEELEIPAFLRPENEIEAEEVEQDFEFPEA